MADLPILSPVTAPEPTVASHVATKNYVDTQVNAGLWLPGHYGYEAWSVDPATAGTSQALTAGVLQLIGIQVGQIFTCSAVVAHVQAAGTSPTNCYLALFNSSGTRLGVSANLASSWGTAGNTVGSFTGVVLNPGLYYAGILCGGGTPPSMSRAASATSVNTGLGAPPFRSATSGSGLTAVPASVTMSSAAVSGFAIFAALK